MRVANGGLQKGCRRKRGCVLNKGEVSDKVLEEGKVVFWMKEK
jgi:hypothetical protein